jgi:ribosomal protein L10
VQALASIPSRNELLAQLLGIMQAPVTGFACALAALAKQREERFQGGFLSAPLSAFLSIQI